MLCCDSCCRTCCSEGLQAGCTVPPLAHRQLKTLQLSLDAVRPHGHGLTKRALPSSPPPPALPSFLPLPRRARAALHHPGDAEERDCAVQRVTAAHDARGGRAGRPSRCPAAAAARSNHARWLPPAPCTPASARAVPCKRLAAPALPHLPHPPRPRPRPPGRWCRATSGGYSRSAPATSTSCWTTCPSRS